MPTIPNNSASKALNRLALDPLARHIGVEIRGADLSNPLDEHSFVAIRDALFQNCIVLLRGQTLNEDHQVGFASRLGELGRVLHKHKGGSKHHPSVMFVSNIRENGELIGALPDGEMHFHSDQCYMERPTAITMLYAIEIPSIGGNTLFASMYAAYEALSPAMKQSLDGKKALNVYDYDNSPNLRAAVKADAPRFAHPIIRTHPVTGRRALYVNRLMTESIIGMPREESNRLLGELFDHAENPAWIYEHHWKPGDLLAWDNRCTTHARTDFDASERRLLRRCVVLGEAPQ
ncbi:MAG: TauD/TfdA family dioxygenase [Betaproteobacteria bacterium]|nr:TauD/TfdA family dioxygenase [Betaproteobacteria bacterium]